MTCWIMPVHIQTEHNMDYTWTKRLTQGQGSTQTFIFVGTGVHKWKTTEAHLFIQPESSAEYSYLIWVLWILFYKFHSTNESC